MATKSNKNILTIIVISSVLLFIAAIYWKQTNQNNEEIVNVKPQPITPVIKIKNEEDLSFLEDDYIDPQTTANNNRNYQNQEQVRKKLSSVLQMAMMYKTPEEIMESVVYYQEKGDEEKVNELINFMLERFPDYKIPNNI